MKNILFWFKTLCFDNLPIIQNKSYPKKSTNKLWPNIVTKRKKYCFQTKYTLLYFLNCKETFESNLNKTLTICLLTITQTFYEVIEHQERAVLLNLINQILIKFYKLQSFFLLHTACSYHFKPFLKLLLWFYSSFYDNTGRFWNQILTRFSHSQFKPIKSPFLVIDH